MTGTTDNAAAGGVRCAIAYCISGPTETAFSGRFRPASGPPGGRGGVKQAALVTAGRGWFATNSYGGLSTGRNQIQAFGSVMSML